MSKVLPNEHIISHPSIETIWTKRKRTGDAFRSTDYFSFFQSKELFQKASGFEPSTLSVESIQNSTHPDNNPLSP